MVLGHNFHQSDCVYFDCCRSKSRGRDECVDDIKIAYGGIRMSSKLSCMRSFPDHGNYDDRPNYLTGRNITCSCSNNSESVSLTLGLALLTRCDWRFHICVGLKMALIIMLRMSLIGFQFFGRRVLATC